MKLTEKKCVPCEGGIPPFDAKQAEKYLKQLPKGWKLEDNGKKIEKEFKFKNYPETVAFAMKVALIAQEEGHHPEIEIHYNRCEIELSTHAIEGLSENDFILAAKIDR